MLRRSLPFIALLAVIAIAVGARPKPKQAPPFSSPVLLIGIAVPPLAGAPFSATVVIQSQLIMEDGSVQANRTIELVARDSIGHTHNERRKFMPQSFHGSPELVQLLLYDPRTSLLMLYTTATHKARPQPLAAEPSAGDIPGPWLQIEDLGTATIKGLVARGTRRTFTVSGAGNQEGDPIQVVDEVWYSEDLHVKLMQRHIDPRLGDQLLELSAIKLEEPPAAMFQRPRGYEIVGAPPPSAPSVPIK